jgi:integrase/recombinase XerC
MLHTYIKYLASNNKRYSAHTITAYSSDLEQFQSFLSAFYQINDPAQASHQMIRSWLVSLLEAGDTPQTINRKIAALKKFYKFLFSRELIAADPMLKVTAPKAVRHLPGFIKETDMEILLNEVNFGEGFAAVSNKLIIETLYLTGIRVSELTAINLNDIDLIRKLIKINGKGNKQRMVPVVERLAASLQNYLPLRADILQNTDSATQALFITPKGRATYQRMIYNIVHNHLALVSTNHRKSPHMLRHSFATALMNHGAELNAVKDLLGHASLAATQVYTHTTIDKIKSIYKHAHPRA